MELLLITFLKYLYSRLWPQQMSTILYVYWKCFLTSFISFDDRINIEGYNLLRPNHPNDNLSGGVYKCFKEYLPILRRGNLCNLPECLVTEIRMGKKKCVYRSSGQSSDEFDTFCSNFNLFLSKWFKSSFFNCNWWL